MKDDSLKPKVKTSQQPPFDELEFNDPIFIIGSPRSGTTMLRSIIDAHPNICCPPWETGLFVNFANFIPVKYGAPAKKESNYCPIEKEALLSWMHLSALELMNKLTGGSDKKRWGEKTPAHVFHTDLILEVFPKAKFVHIIRNGRDVVKSLLNVHWGPKEITWSTSRWRDSVKAGLQAREKWGSEVVYEIRYETLISQTEECVASLCDFLGEVYSEDMLNFHDPKKNIWQRKEKPVSETPINSHNYRELSLRERIHFKANASELMNLLGY